MVKKDNSPHQSGFVTVNGVKLHFLDWGGKGEALLFITGSGDNAHVFDEFALKFTDRFRVLALTRRGYGESEKPLTGYDIPTLTEDVRQFLDYMKIQKVILAGHSAGGNELLQFAKSYPKRIIKLVFLDAAYDRREVLTLELNDPLIESSIENNSSSELTIEEKIQAAYFKHMDEYIPDFNSIKVPALSFYAIHESHWGIQPDMEDSLKNKAQNYIVQYVQPYQWRNIERFKKEVPNGRVKVLRNTKHYIFRDSKRKAEVVKEMRAFLLDK